MANLNLVQAIDVRTSKRIFKDVKVESTIINQINSLINKYNQESGLSFRLLENAELAFKSFLISYGKFKGINNAIAIVASKATKDYFEKAGFFGEHLLLNLVTFGLDTCWVGVNFNRNSDIFKLNEEEVLIALIVFGYAEDLPSKVEDERYGITHRPTLLIEDITSNDQILPHQVEEGIVSVLKAPTYKNKQPFRFDYKNKQLFISVEASKPEMMIELGIAKAHYVISVGGKFEWGNNQPHNSSL